LHTEFIIIYWTCFLVSVICNWPNFLACYIYNWLCGASKM